MRHKVRDLGVFFLSGGDAAYCDFLWKRSE